MNIGRVAVLALVAVSVLLLVPSEIRRESEPAVLEDIRRIQTAEVEYFSRYRRFGGLSELAKAERAQFRILMRACREMLAVL